MSNNFISYNRNQMFLLPLSSDEFIPPLHLARVIEAIVEELDLSEFYAVHSNEGRPAYHPKMLLTLSRSAGLCDRSAQFPQDCPASGERFGVSVFEWTRATGLSDDQ